MTSLGSVKRSVKALARNALPALLLIRVLRPGLARSRLVSASALLAFWTATYSRYRRAGREQTAREREALKSVDWQTFRRHYDERVPTIEEEFDIWGAYHQHRHEMRYDLVADAVRAALPRGGRMLDVGCGSALVADRVVDLDGLYVGTDLGGHQVSYGASKHMRRETGELRCGFARSTAEQLPFADATFDVVVMSEVIEHLLQPELAVWEIARVLKPGGTFVMTTNNASEMPLCSPLSDLFAWIEKALGMDRPELISLRPWVWPEAVDPDLTPPGAPPVFLPHTHHIAAETKAMFAAAGLDTVRTSTFEFPPPQSRTARWLEQQGGAGRRAVDVIEAACRATPFVRRLGCHLMVVSRRSDRPVASHPPPGIWPGPFS